MHGHADHEPCGLNCPVGGADSTTHQATIDGITLCSVDRHMEGSMKTIYKYRLEPQGETLLTLRGGVLSAGVQGDDIMLWAVHDDDAAERKVRVHVMGTGHLFVDAPETSFIGTVFLGPLVFHIFATPA